MFTKRQSVALYLLAALTVLFAGTVIYYELKPPGHELQHYYRLPRFELTSQDGAEVTLDDFKGKVWLADFVYTTCPGPCPIITRHMAQLQGKLAGDGGVRFVSISTDPVHDTPPVLKTYAARYGATDKWSFLTGPQDKVYDLIQHGFMLPIQAPQGQQIIHSTRIMLVDKEGTVRAFYEGATAEADEQILADVERLRAE